MSVRIQGAQYALKHIFDDQFIFEIPSYQRPYSWTPEQAGELLDDLLSAAVRARYAGKAEAEPYFLGSIVLAKAEGDAHAKVIDGQQRLTTLTILLAVLATQAAPPLAAEFRSFILQEGGLLLGTKTQYRLTLRPRDAAFFRHYVQEKNGIAELLQLDSAQMTDPARNMQANAALFMERLKVLTDEERTKLGEFMMQDCFLVAVSTPDTESAFRIFTVLNDRGLNLSHADIIKSELIGRVPDEDMQEATDIWEAPEEELGIEAFADLFGHIRMIYAKTKARESLIRSFRAQVMPTISDAGAFISDVVAPYGEVFQRIKTGTWEGTANAERINNLLGWLNRIDNADWVPLAIRYLHLYGNDSSRITGFLAKLERLAASMFIRRVFVNSRLDRYGHLLKQLESGEDLSAGGLGIDLTDQERTDTIAALDGELYLESRTRTYVLLRLDEALSAGGAIYDHSIITVEHVLPQTPKRGSQWTEWFSEEERAWWVHRLANLVLLPRRRNSAAQNHEFARKKREYFRSPDGASPFVLTTQVLHEREWRPEMLQQRQEQLLKRLGDVWDL